MLYTLNKYDVVYQLYFNKTGTNKLMYASAYNVFFPSIFCYMYEPMTFSYLKVNIKLRMTICTVPENSVYWESDLKTFLDSEQFAVVKDNNS